jgi:hypothetical protein
MEEKRIYNSPTGRNRMKSYRIVFGGCSLILRVQFQRKCLEQRAYLLPKTAIKEVVKVDREDLSERSNCQTYLYYPLAYE